MSVVKVAAVRAIIFVSPLFFAFSGFAQLGTGSISGFAQDASGGAIPRVTMTLMNPGTVGGNQQTVTDERGGYQFIRLVPAAYGIKAELTGFRTAVRESIEVRADSAARVDVRLEVGQRAETVTVTDEVPLLDTTSTFSQAVLDRQVIDELPNGRDLWSIARLVPAVLMNTYDVGGTNSFAQATPSVHGSQAGETKYLIDGLDVSDNQGTGNFLIAYFDPNAYEEVNVQTASAPAERARGGVLYNLVTKTGTNTFHGSFNFVGSERALQSNNLTPTLLQQLQAQIPASALKANPGLVPDTRILGLFNTSAAFSGPILRNRLWFTSTATMQSLNQPRLGSYNSDGTEVIADGRSKDFTIKFSWQVNQKNQVHFNYIHNVKHSYHNTVLANTNFFTSDATWGVHNTGDISQVKWTSTLSPRLVFDFSASLMAASTTLTPQPNITPGTIPHFDAVTLTYSDAATYYDFQPSQRAVVNTSLSYIIGKHEIKVGTQSDHSEQHTFAWSSSNDPSGLVAIFRNGVPNSVNTYNTPVTYQLVDFENAAFIQDKWTPLRRLTVNIGLRFDKDNGRLPASCQPQTIFISTAQCFPEIKNVPNFFSVAPRFGMIYDVFGNGKTALKVSADRYHFGTGPGFPSNVNPLKVTFDTRTWTDLNGDGIPQLNELGPSTGFNIGSTNHYGSDVKWPYSNEYSVEIEQRIPGDIILSAAYYHRETKNNIGSQNLAVPTSSYTPIQVTEKTSGQSVTVYNPAASTRGQFNTLYDNFADLNSQYNGVDLTANKRLSRHWMLMTGLILGHNHGDTYGTSDQNNPNFVLRRSVLPLDVPVTFKVSGVYELPYGVNFSSNFQHFTGFPVDETVSVSSNTVALTQVTQSLRVVPFGTNRLPDVNILDFSARKIFHIRERIFAEPTVDLFNLLNSSAIQAQVTQLGPTYLQAQNMLRGRLLRFGVELRF